MVDLQLTADPVKDYEDIDAENISDPFQVAMYANDIFSHYKEREVGYVVRKSNIPPSHCTHLGGNSTTGYACNFLPTQNRIRCTVYVTWTFKSTRISEMDSNLYWNIQGSPLGIKTIHLI